MADPTTIRIDKPQRAEGGIQSSCGGIPSSPIRVGVLGDLNPLPAFMAQLFASRTWCICEPIDLSIGGSESGIKRFDVAVLLDVAGDVPDRNEPWYVERTRQLDSLREHRLSVLILTDRPWLFAGGGVGAMCLPSDTTLEMVHGALKALAHSRPLMRQIEKEVANMQRLNETLQKHFEEVDHDLRLASRLQREFLPHVLPHVGPVQFTTIFHPCSWVSGDIFDVFRLDEDHVGFYLADAVGHGVAAGLLTMYIKHAIQPKRILRNGYELVKPAEVLAMLNDQLVAHELPDSQFITAWYGLVNTKTLEMRYSIAGHPPAIRLDAGGEVSELHGHGCLLGIFANQEFAEDSVQLDRGDRLMVYSDGLEGALISHRPLRHGKPELQAGIAEILRGPKEALHSKLTERLDSMPGSLRNSDDVSAVILDVDGADGTR